VFDQDGKNIPEHTGSIFNRGMLALQYLEQLVEALGATAKKHTADGLEYEGAELVRDDVLTELQLV
jgi:hypothetical protein